MNFSLKLILIFEGLFYNKIVKINLTQEEKEMDILKWFEHKVAEDARTGKIDDPLATEIFSVIDFYKNNMEDFGIHKTFNFTDFLNDLKTLDTNYYNELVNLM